MPIYEYVCGKCGIVWMGLRLDYDTAPPMCRECKLPMQRVYSTFSFTMK